MLVGMTRQPRLGPEDLDAEQAAVYRGITEGPRSSGPFPLTEADGSLRGPFGGFLLSPRVGDALQRLGAAVRYESGLTDRCRELAILAVAAARRSDFEREAHEAAGLAAGLTPAEMAAVAEGSSTLGDPTEAACLRMVTALLAGDVDDRTWSACVPPLDAAAVFELTTLVGYYSTLALQMRVFRLE